MWAATRTERSAGSGRQPAKRAACNSEAEMQPAAQETAENKAMGPRAARSKGSAGKGRCKWQAR